MAENLILSGYAEDCPSELLAAIDAGLHAHNLAAAPLEQVRSLAVGMHLPDGALLGGALGRSWGLCCELQQLWVREDRRGQGLGATLMRAFEAQAAARGCELIYLETFSFQAPGFYRRLGYEEAACLEGFAPGLAKYLMRKRLERAAP